MALISLQLAEEDNSRQYAYCAIHLFITKKRRLVEFIQPIIFM